MRQDRGSKGSRSECLGGGGRKEGGAFGKRSLNTVLDLVCAAGHPKTKLVDVDVVDFILVHFVVDVGL